MRIGIFTNTYKPMINENAIIVENLVKGLEGLGHKVFVITHIVLAAICLLRFSWLMTL